MALRIENACDQQDRDGADRVWDENAAATDQPARNDQSRQPKRDDFMPGFADTAGDGDERDDQEEDEDNQTRIDAVPPEPTEQRPRARIGYQVVVGDVPVAPAAHQAP